MPLKKAVASKNAEVIRFLLANGFVPDPGDELLHMAAADPDADREVVELLIPHCNINQARFNGATPLHLVKKFEIAQLLLRHGADSSIRDNAGELPHQTQEDPRISALLQADYDEKHPSLPRLDVQNRAGATDWDNRFSCQLVSIHELIPCGGESPSDLRFSYQGNEFTASRRFYNSLAKKMRFSTNIFNYFTPSEVLDRIAQKAPSATFAVTFDHHENSMLGVVDEGKKMLPAGLACRIFADDPRTRKISYHDGIWQAELALDECFRTPQAGEYFRKFKIMYPVDGVGMPCIYLSMLRQICQNGAVAQVSQFRTDIEINDESGLHLSKLLRSFSNQSGFAALEERLEIAAGTAASVNELLSVDRLLMNNIPDRHVYRELHNRLEEIAGEPCLNYGTTSLNNIPHKRRSLLPVECSVNDLLNFCSELTTHHSNLLNNPTAFDVSIGETLAGEFDLEGMYHHRRPSPAFFMNDLDLPTWRTRESREIWESSEVVNG